MSKELTPLEALIVLKFMNEINGWFEFDFAIIEKTLKAFEIIKEKKVNTLLVMNTRDYNEYCRYMSDSFEYEALTQQEYILLKGVLL